MIISQMTDTLQATIAIKIEAIGFRMPYLHFTSAHSKSQDQCHAFFDSEYPGNGDILKTHYY